MTRAQPHRALPNRGDELTRWTAGLFMTGSALFSFGAAGALFGISAASAGRVFFAGSIFFTTAAYLQLVQVINGPDTRTDQHHAIAMWGWQPERLEWWATFIQLLGTLMFNLSTFDAMQSLDPLAEDVLVWAPDALGSICFLIASYVAFVAVCRGWPCWRPHDAPWWVAATNLLGSIAFGLSAVTSIYVLDTGMMLDPWSANAWTLVGGLCFFVGAYLLRSS